MAKSKPAKVKNPNSGGGNHTFTIIISVIVLALILGVVFIVNYYGGKDFTEKAVEWIDTEQANSLEVDIIEENDVTLMRFTSDNTSEDSKRILLAEDSFCSYCAALNSTIDETLVSSINDGSATLDIMMMRFMDGPGVTDGPSTHASASILAAADKGDARSAWNIMSAIYGNQNDFRDAKQEDYGQMASLWGAEGEVVDAIKDASYQDKARESDEKGTVFLQNNGDGRVATPKVFYPDDNMNEAMINYESDEWLKEYING